MKTLSKILFKRIGLFLAVTLLALTGCNEQKLKRPTDAGAGKKPAAPAGGMDKAFARELAREFAREFARELAKQNITLPAGSGGTTPVEPVTPTGAAVELNSAEEVMDFYEAHPKAFVVATPADLPTNLQWENGSELKEFGSPKAKRGGTFHEYMADFPRTLRLVGPDASGSFRSRMLDYNSLSLVMAHPNGDGYHPGLAKEWAYSADRKTVYFRLDPDARYSDGEPVRVTDYFFSLYFFRSEHIKGPWYNDFFSKEKFPNITVYDEHTLSITYYKAKPDVIERVAGVRPIPEHFYSELDEQFVEDFQFKFEPNTGPYEVRPENVEKGKAVTLTRVPNWWADKKKFYRYRFNPEAVKVTVIREPAKVFELFLKSELDWHGLGLPEYWYEKLPNDHKLVTAGYVHKVQFYNDVPRPTWALRLNSSHPVLSNRDVRVGLNYAMNFDVVIAKVFRGDPVRMNTVADGYGPRSHPTLKARPFSVKKAKEHFAKAGYTRTGADGILMNAGGKRLSFTFTTPYKRLEDVMTVLKEEAKKAGVELEVEIMERTAAWKKISEKNHEIMLGALNVSVEIAPRFWEPYHSDNAYEEPKEERYDAQGRLREGLKPKPVTNNFCMLADKDIDDLIEKYRVSEDLDELTGQAKRLMEMIHAHGSFIPGWVRPWYRAGHWRWIQWPEGYNVKESREPYEFHVHWIDSDIKAKTIQDMAAGRKSGAATIQVFDQYKTD
jgi:microcin C transport system substrate-binding protein